MPKNGMCKNCLNLTHHWCERVIDSPDEDLERDCTYFCQKTNADSIRAMSDEELANWLDYMYGRCDWCDTDKIGTDDCSDIACTDCIFKWLQQPAEERP